LVNDLIEARIERLPHRPGVYIMRDAARNIIYVGKAKDLYNRVSSYFRSSIDRLTPKTQLLVEQVTDIDFYVASSEQEALIMELNFIKQYHPRFNISLMDDKTFPYLKINTREAWPRVYSTRRFEQDGGRYFGPFSSAGSVKQTLRTLKRIFPLRFCNKELNAAKPQRPCLEYHLGHCLGPCTGNVAREEYDEVIKEVILFLEGKQDNVIRKLQDRMSKASEAMNYEVAAKIRDQIQAMNAVIEGEKTAAVIRGEEDVIAFVQEGDKAYIQVFFIRANKLTGRESFLMRGTRDEEPRKIMTGFIEQYYSSCPQIPPLLLLQYPVEDKEVIESWLKEKRGTNVEIHVPKRGLKKQLIDMAMENARQGLDQLKIKEMATARSLDKALSELQEELRLPELPKRMEAYDISNIQGTSAVGSMVVFENGLPNRSHYRRFRIKTVEGANDYAMLQEVLRRRFRRAAKRDEEAESDSWQIKPDLVLIDGGKGQLNSALEVFKGSPEEIPFIGLAKENEEIFLPHRKNPVVLPRSSPGLQLLQRLRDEAHRFAVSYHTNVRTKKAFKSVLDSVPGIGPKRKSALLRRFGSVQGIRDASIDEIIAATGMTGDQAGKVKEYL
jgi:excinuclease ABC subunit C